MVVPSVRRFITLLSFVIRTTGPTAAVTPEKTTSMRKATRPLAPGEGTGLATLTVSLCFLGALCEGFDVQAAGVAAAGVSRELHATPQQLALFFSASGAGLLIGALFGGRASDRVGRKSVLVVSITAFGLFSLLTALCGSMQSLAAARLLTGFGLGGAMPTLIALAAESSASRSRNAGIAIAYVGMPLGGVIASLVAFRVPLEAWRVIFLCGGVAPLIIAPALLIFLPAAKPTTAAPNARADGNTLHDLFASDRRFNTLLLWAAFFLIVLTLHLMLNWLPLLLVGRGLLHSQSAIAQAAFNAGAILAVIVGALLDTSWRRTGIIASLVALPALLVSLSLSPAQPTFLFGLAFLLGGAILAQQVILFAAVTVSYPAASRGTGVGAAIAAGRLGSLTGPLFAAALVAAGRTASQVLLGVLPIVVICGLCTALLARRTLPPSVLGER